MSNELMVKPESEIERLILAAVKMGDKMPVDNMERLLTMRRELKAEQARDMFFIALSEFQANCPIIPKDHKAGSGGFQYNYAPLDTIQKHIAPILKLTGLSFTFDTEDTEKEKTTICTVHHVAGHSQKSRFKVPIDTTARMNDTQKQGSAGTYAKRYALCNALGILTGDDDDDARATVTPTPQKAVAHHPAPKSTTLETITDQEIKDVFGCNAHGFISDIIQGPKPTKTGGYRTKIVINGEGYYTFDKKVVELANEIVNSDEKANLEFKEGKYGKDIVKLDLLYKILPASEVFGGREPGMEG